MKLEEYYNNRKKGFSELSELDAFERDLHIFEEFWMNNPMTGDDWSFAEKKGIDRSLFDEETLSDISEGKVQMQGLIDL